MILYLDAAGKAPPIPAAAQNLAIINGPYVGINAAITKIQNSKLYNKSTFFVIKIYTRKNGTNTKTTE